MAQLEMDQRPTALRPSLLWWILRLLALLAIVASIIACASSLTLRLPDPTFIPLLGP
jgi:hypothetical protein